MAATRRHTCKSLSVAVCLCDKQDTTSSDTRLTTRCLQPRLKHHCIHGGQKTYIRSHFTKNNKEKSYRLQNNPAPIQKSTNKAMGYL